jgi:uncharacterized oxidoreductase
MKPSGNTILVTGGGSGIGRGMARWWAERGNTVIVAGRNAATLAETRGNNPAIHPMTFDAASAADIARFAAEVTAAFPALNVLVNNAGVMMHENLTAARDLSPAEAMVATNLLGPIRLIDALVGHLSARPDAAIVNVTSGLAFVPLPATATYSATKAALHSYTVSLRTRLVGKVEVIEIAPPGVRTELTQGQSQEESFMPLDDFIAETMAQFAAEPTPPEVLTGMVKFLRNAEAEGRFDQVLGVLAKAY